MAGDQRELTNYRGDLEPGEDYEGLLFADAEFGEATAGNCHFLECAFRNVSFGGGRLRKTRFTDVTMRDSRFVATDLAETGWQDTVLSGCALAGVQAFSAALRRVTFRDGKLDSPSRTDGHQRGLLPARCGPGARPRLRSARGVTGVRS